MSHSAHPFPRPWLLVCCLVALALCHAAVAHATDVSGLAEDEKFLPTNITLISGMSVETNEVRRPARMTHEPKASVGVWCPWLEPPPVVRDRANNLDGRKAKIYVNSGATRDKFPFIVKDVASGKFYVYRHVRYEWKFERSPADDAQGGNKPGKSGPPTWTPFYRQALLESEVLSFIQRFAEDKATNDDLPEKKCYANRHTTPYDSGITGNTQVAESTILQQVGMTLTYDRAEVTPEKVDGPGYPEGDLGTADLADPFHQINGTAELNQPVDADKWVSSRVINPVPKHLAKIWTLGDCSVYTLCYVEDYRKPEGTPLASRGNTYEGTVGGYIKGGVVIDYEDDNINAKMESDQMQAKLKYYVANGDIYKVENPFYGETSTHETRAQPYLYFFYLGSNYEFGPYTCAAQRDRELDWYSEGHPYWSGKEPAAIIDYVRERYGNAWNSASIPDWEMGVVYVTLGLDGKGKNSKRITEQLNEAWTTGSMAKCTYFHALRDDLKARAGSTPSPAISRALTCLAALEQAIARPESVGIRGDRTFFRFAPAGYDPNLGSYCVGPQTLEKNNPQVHQEWIADKQGVPIKKGKWILAEKRLILPKHFTQAACDSCSTDLFTSKQILQVVLADCCGNMTTVNPSTVNTRDGVFIHDDAHLSLPVPQMTVHNPMSKIDIPIQVPGDDSLGYGQKLIVKSKKDGSEKAYGPNEYGGQFDLAANDFYLQDRDGKRELIQFFPDNDPEKAIYEDTRVQFTLGGYDNIDGMSSFRGVGKQRLTIYTLDASGNRIGPETLEYTDDTGQVRTGEFIERTNSGDPYKFNPQYKFHHIFRKPGHYQIEYVLTEYTNPSGPKQSRTLTYNVRVLDAKTENRSLQHDTIRQ